jgi:hypothetical protein
MTDNRLDRRKNDVQIALILEKIEKLEEHQDELRPSVAVLQTTLQEHLQKYDLNKLEESARWNHVLVAQEQNTDSIKDLITSTEDLLGAWRAANGAVKVGAAISKFVKWVGSFAVLAAIGAWIIDVVDQ